MESVTVNGIEKTFAAGRFPRTVSELLACLDVQAATVVAELDGRIVQRDEFDRTPIEPGQKIELIRLMGGG